MLREELSEEKQKEYDTLTANMMREIEEELAKQPEGGKDSWTDQKIKFTEIFPISTCRR